MGRIFSKREHWWTSWRMGATMKISSDSKRSYNMFSSLDKKYLCCPPQIPKRTKSHSTPRRQEILFKVTTSVAILQQIPEENRKLQNTFPKLCFND
jgi:hypothetical protein